MSEINENEICEFSFNFERPTYTKGIALTALIDAHGIDFIWNDKNQVTILNQKIKNHAFIEKLFNLNLYE